MGATRAGVARTKSRRPCGTGLRQPAKAKRSSRSSILALPSCANPAPRVSISTRRTTQRVRAALLMSESENRYGGVSLKKTEKKQITRSDPNIKRGARLPVGEVRVRELVAAGFNEGVLRAFVDAFPRASKERKPPLAGIKNRQITGLAERLCHVASEIMSVNEEVSRGSGCPLSDVPGARLPVELGLYAMWLTALLKTPLEHRASERQLLELLLIAATRKFTGKPHYTALSELLWNASGEKANPEALLQLACDHASQIEQMEGQLDTILAPLLRRLAD